MKTIILVLCLTASLCLALDEWVWLDYQRTNGIGAASMSVADRDDRADLQSAGILIPSQLPALIHVPSKSVALRPASIAAGKAQLQGNRYVLDNQYLLLCDYLAGTNTHAFMGSDSLTQIMVTMFEVDPNKETVLFQYMTGPLLTALVQEGGPNWFKTCVWHPEPWAVEQAQANHNALFGKIPISASKSSRRLGVRLVSHLVR